MVDYGQPVVGMVGERATVVGRGPSDLEFVLDLRRQFGFTREPPAECLDRPQRGVVGFVGRAVDLIPEGRTASLTLRLLGRSRCLGFVGEVVTS